MLVQSQDEFEAQITAVQSAIDMVQIDIADGIFVPNTTWRDPGVASNLLKIDCELHLMVENPLAEAEQWKNVSHVKRVLFHYDAVGPDEAGNVITELQSFGWDVGMVLDPDTPLDVVDPHIDNIQAVMFMGVHAGFQGQEYIPETTVRMRQLKKTYPDLFISLDGAVNLKTLPDITTSGIDAVCPGSAVFHTEKTPTENIEELQNLINTLTA